MNIDHTITAALPNPTAQDREVLSRAVGEYDDYDADGDGDGDGWYDLVVLSFGYAELSAGEDGRLWCWVGAGVPVEDLMG